MRVETNDFGAIVQRRRDHWAYAVQGRYTTGITVHKYDTSQQVGPKNWIVP